MKSYPAPPVLTVMSHSPRGGCGLKSILVFDELKKRVSLSARRVWIEIHVLSDTSVSITSLSARRVWIEIMTVRVLPAPVSRHSPRGGCGLKFSCKNPLPALIPSLSARRVWIEIAQGAGERRPASVTLREEGVD